MIELIYVMRRQWLEYILTTRKMMETEDDRAHKCHALAMVGIHPYNWKDDGD